MVTKEKAMYTVREASEILCVTAHTVRAYIAGRKLRAVRRGDGYYLVHANDLRVFLGLDPDERLVPVSVHDGLGAPVSLVEQPSDRASPPKEKCRRPHS